MGTERVQQSIEIEAPPQRVFDILTDHEAIPQWQSAVRSTKVLSRDGDGRGLDVEFHTDVKVKRIRYVQRYSYEPPRLMATTLIEGDLKASDSTYAIDDLGGSRSRVTADLEIDPGVYVPGLVKRMLTGKMLKGSLEELKSRAESGGR